MREETLENSCKKQVTVLAMVLHKTRQRFIMLSGILDGLSLKLI